MTICSRDTDGETEAEESQGACPGSAAPSVVKDGGPGPQTSCLGLQPLDPHGLFRDGAEWREKDPKGEAPGTLEEGGAAQSRRCSLQPRLVLSCTTETLAIALIHSCPA